MQVTLFVVVACIFIHHGRSLTYTGNPKYTGNPPTHPTKVVIKTVDNRTIICIDDINW